MDFREELFIVLRDENYSLKVTPMDPPTHQHTRYCVFIAPKIFEVGPSHILISRRMDEEGVLQWISEGFPKPDDELVEKVEKAIDNYIEIQTTKEARKIIEDNERKEKDDWDQGGRLPPTSLN